MQAVESRLFDELRCLIGELGKDGGKISPSIYDTAQRLRFYPPEEGPQPGLAWLLEQQQADGGWCDPAVPAARDASTLAAILAIKQYRADRTANEAVDAGLAFLRRQAGQWRDIHLDALPIAVEVILPKLIAEANAAGLAIDPAPYARLYALGKKKLEIVRQMTNQMTKLGGLPPSYSWEAFDETATSDLLDPADSVGHSPAATAKWLQLAKSNPTLRAEAARAERYLERANQATGIAVPGVVPVFYPVVGYELCYGLNALMLAGLMQEPELQDVVKPLLRKLKFILESENGVSAGEQFIKDVDDTAVAMSVLQTSGYRVEPHYLMQFFKNDHFFTFVRELNPSVFSNAHAVHALALGGVRIPEVEQFLLERQDADGKWTADKWHCSWRFTTLEVVNALTHTGHVNAVRAAMDALIDGQIDESHWTFNGYISALDTAYTVIALTHGQSLGLLPQQGERSLEKAAAWLTANQRGYVGERRWIAKELYSIPKVEQAYVLAALLANEPQAQAQPFEPAYA